VALLSLKMMHLRLKKKASGGWVLSMMCCSLHDIRIFESGVEGLFCLIYYAHPIIRMDNSCWNQPPSLVPCCAVTSAMVYTPMAFTTAPSPAPDSSNP
jgi:hypothetical protein